MKKDFSNSENNSYKLLGTYRLGQIAVVPGALCSLPPSL